MNNLKNILIIRLDEIGDVVMTTGFLRELRRNHADSRITLIVKPQTINLVEKCPYVDDIYTYDPGSNKPLRPFFPRLWRSFQLMQDHIWKSKHNLAIYPRWGVDSSFGTILTFLSRADHRIGYSERANPGKQRYNRGFDLLLTDTIDDRTIKHEVEHNYDILRHLGFEVIDKSLELWLTDEDHDYANRILGDHGVNRNETLIAFGVGAGSLRRVWPIDRFLKLAEWIIDELPAKIIIVGGEEDQPSGEYLKSNLGDLVINLAGKTTLRQSGALLELCDIFVGNDSGPMHLAAAVGIPVIEISCHPEDGDLGAPNSPMRFGPWDVPQIILQPHQALSPCVSSCKSQQPHCIREVDLEKVQMAVEELLHECVLS